MFVYIKRGSQARYEKGNLKLFAFAYEDGSRREGFDGLGVGCLFSLNSAGSRTSSRRYGGQFSLLRALNTVL